MAIEKWKFDPVHSTVGFSVRHLMISRVHGVFKSWSGTLETDDAHPENTKLAATIDAASIDTKEPQRDDHLRSADFFDAPNHATITFQSTSVQKLNGDHYKLIGNLTIRGTTKPVTLDVEHFGRQKDPWGGERAGFSAKTTIDRRDYGLTFNMPLDGGGLMVGEKVDITLDVQAVKEATAGGAA
jgi:polyisoprenoid-binding protein YceI